VRNTLRGLLAEGARCARDGLRGKSSLGSLPPSEFARAVLSSLRPQFFALPAGAALAGAAAALPSTASPRVLLAAAAAAAGWGVGQLLNDLIDRTADAVDAPDRPAVRGLLPEGPTVMVAAGIGTAVAIGTVLVHPLGALLAASAALLLLTYDAAKAFPLAGNLVHGALIANAALIGAAAALPAEPLRTVIEKTWFNALLAGGWAAVYLEANYEKDRVGDAHARQHTLPQLLGLRASALARATAGVAIAVAAARSHPFSGSVGRTAWWAALALLAISALRVTLEPTERAALRSYRYAVHAAVVGMLALGSAALGDAGAVVAIVVAVALTEHAFHRTPNP
jgi:geranylgeranylglycerol-phosphate geranylgeranyltransferase